MLKSLLCLAFLFSVVFGDLVAMEYEGGVFFPADPYPIPGEGVFWFNTCYVDSAEDLPFYPIYLKFYYNDDNVTDTEPYYSTNVEELSSLWFGNVATKTYNNFQVLDSSVQFVYGQFSGFSITAHEVIQAGSVIAAKINSFTWELSDLSDPFSPPIASGYYFNCNLSDENFEEDNDSEGCRKYNCNSDCYLANKSGCDDY